jgi:hypothetical protein
MLLGLFRKLFPLACALEPKWFAVGTLIHIRQLPARFGLSTQRKRVFGHGALQRKTVGDIVVLFCLAAILQRLLAILGVNF